MVPFEGKQLLDGLFIEVMSSNAAATYYPCFIAVDMHGHAHDELVVSDVNHVDVASHLI